MSIVNKCPGIWPQNLIGQFGFSGRKHSLGKLPLLLIIFLSAIQVRAQLADLVPLSVTNLQQLTVGQTVHFQTTVTNEGAGAINAGVNDRVSLSTTPDTNGIVVQVEFGNNVTIGGNSSYNSFDPYGAFKFTIPGTLSAGTYYLIYQVDVDNDVAESNETNNTLVQQVQVLIPDLVPLKILPQSTLTAGQSVLFSSLITNQGSGTQNGYLTDRITLSTTPDTSGAIIHVDLNYGVNAAGGSSYSPFDPYGYFTFTIPGNLSAGMYYLIYQVDVDNDVAESNETNNTLVQTVQVGVPDLVPYSLTPQVALTAGQTIHFTSVVTNEGAGTVNGGLTDRVTLSTTPSTNGAIVQVDFGYGVNVAGNASYTPFDPYGSLKITIPANVIPGNYYLIYQVDVDNDVAESNETNNTLVQAVSVSLPDLVPLQLTQLQTLTVGQTSKFQSLVTNQGAGIINGAIIDRLTLSTTPSTNGAIISVDFENDENLGGFFSYNSFDPYGAFKLAIPPTLASGTNYYLVYEVDVNNTIPESNENNNTLVQQVPVLIPDLAPLKLTQEQLLTAGQTIYFQTLVTNQGAGFINGAIIDRLTLSTTPSTNDAIMHVDFEDDENLGGFSSFTSFDPYGNFKLVVPGNLPPGTNYYFIYEVDVNNTIVEGNETNNTLVQPAQVSIPDLAPLTVAALGPLTEGLPVYFSTMVTNDDNGFINGVVTDRVTLSTTATTNGAVAHIDFANGVNIGANSSYSSFDPYGQFSLVVPANLPAGTNYYLIYEVNVGSPPIAESNPTNNTLVIRTSVGIGDLVAVSLTTNNQATAGFPFSVSYTITNAGSPLNGSWEDQLTLSTTPTPGGAVANWTYNDSHSLGIGANYSAIRSITLPQIATNNYYLILQSDAGNAIPESNESNNMVVLPIHVTEQPAAISLVTSTNQINKETCVPVLCSFSATVQTGSYTVTNVTFLDGQQIIGQTTNISNPAVSVVLDVGIHNIVAQATDIFTNQVISSNLILNLHYPTNLNVLRADLDLNTNFVGCMCALTGNSYAILTTTNLLGQPTWQTNLMIPNLATNMLFFTNKPVGVQRFYRAELQH